MLAVALVCLNIGDQVAKSQSNKLMNPEINQVQRGLGTMG
jgi:hypothetical protein